ncbi:uncharacterized protein BT62DRAFT_535171 [Guyanagaster necrorhizus]|uniref:BZIP domain-containing protein n=1 Tax=Guyanagaster necrorhizus TaxID=856835 RepID=A0A9P7W026_9AGAR|nr:uncharacterized protein BT62DRAFT_535171 [Guyanagaster necrorhizus MCA 3950]KAG7450781.1 hypothetical protein BT62DRAFT_535171 [Guyanagaster necrorhizus MCA 3950]
MESFSEITPLWDLSQATTFSQLADDDFLALLQKQFPSAANPPSNLGGDFAVDPQSISRFSLPSLNPPSEDSSPSPPRSGEPSSSVRNQDDDDSFVQGDSALKRKASDEDLEEGPSQKSQHTAGNNKKGASSSKRKSTGNGPDENRLLKRKEQNRAAQRAFRERKEKHVKDLEDKVAALEARNEQTTSENENLRDLLARIQSENVALRQGSFTFQVPKTAGRSIPSPSTSATLSPPETSLSASFSRNSPKLSLQKYTNPLDLSSLTAFDPSVLDLLDEPQQTATTSGGAMEVDFGYNKDKGYLTSNFTTIASNPAFFSLASMFDPTPTPSPPTSNSISNSDTPSFNFDLSSLTAWSPSSSHDTGTLDDLFGSYMDHTQGIDLNSILGPPSSISPIVHQANLNTHVTSPDSSSSSPSSNGSDPSLFGTPIEGSSSESDIGHDEATCPKTKSECVRHVDSGGLSPFVTNSSFFRKAGDNTLVSGVSCQGSSSFPKTTKNDSNIEVLSAWRSITSNPDFKDCDINELCSEFSSKARCDGSKVVLEPSGVQHILKNLSKNRA